MTDLPPVLMRSNSRTSKQCDVCGLWLNHGQNKHDAEIHAVAALERIAGSLEVIAIRTPPAVTGEDPEAARETVT